MADGEPRDPAAPEALAGNLPAPDAAHFLPPDPARLFAALPTHPPRILLLYGSLRPRSYSRLLTLEAQRLLDARGCDTRVYHANGLPLPDDAEASLESWRRHTNTFRSHASLGYGPARARSSRPSRYRLAGYAMSNRSAGQAAGGATTKTEPTSLRAAQWGLITSTSPPASVARGVWARTAN